MFQLTRLFRHMSVLDNLLVAGYVYVLSLGRITAEGAREDFKGDLHEQVRQWLGITF